MAERWGNAHTHVLLAVIRRHQLCGRCTVRGIADDLELSVSCTHKLLRELKAAGVLTWEAGRKGTLRPLVQVVPGRR